MKSPLISIIIPVYNVADYIETTINSIINQDFSNYEIILINDGSTDNSGLICTQYSQKYSQIVLFHQTNLGVSTARNKGVELASGEYIWFVDADDILAVGALLTLKDLLVKYEEVEVLGFSFKSFHDNDLNPFVKRELLSYVNGEVFLKHYNRLALWTFLYKKSIISANEIRFHTGVSIFEDNLFNIEVFNNASKIIQTNEHLYIYRTDRLTSAINQSDTNKILISLISILKRLNEIELVELSKSNLNYMKVSFWLSFQYYFDKIKNNLSQIEIKKMSLVLFSNTKIIETVRAIELYNNFDILMYCFFKSHYLNIRRSFLYQFVRKIIVKISIIYSK